MSETTTTQATQTAEVPANGTTTAAAAATPVTPKTEGAVVTAAPDQNAGMRTALLRAQVAQVLGPVQAPWVLDAAIASAKPDLLSDFTGLTGPSADRVKQWKSENAFAFQAAAAPTTQAASAATQGGATVSATQTQAAADPLPATPGSNTGASAGLSTDEVRRLGQIHVDPKTIVSHPDWNRVKAFWGVQ